MRAEGGGRPTLRRDADLHSFSSAVLDEFLSMLDDEESSDTPLPEVSDPAPEPSPAPEPLRPPPRARSATGATRGRTARQNTLERNREAQRRFRERQRDRVAGLERAAADAAAREAGLRAALAAARARIAELEVALDERGPADDPLVVTSALAPAAAPPPSLARPAAAALAALSLDAPGSALTPADIRSLTTDDVVAFHSSHVSQLSALLAEADDARAAPTARGAARERIDRLARESIALFFRILLAAPGSIVALGRAGAGAAAAAGVQPAPASEADPLWPVVAAKMHLAPGQRRAMVELFRSLAAEVAPLRARRARAVAVLSSTLHVRASGFEHAAQTLAAAEAVADVRRAMKEEVLVRLAASHELFTAALEPHQIARAMVHSYPRPPDVLAVTTWVAAGEGDAGAAAALAAAGAVVPGALEGGRAAATVTTGV